MDQDDINRLYTPDEAREIADAWDEFISLVTKGSEALWVLDVISYEDMQDLAQCCRDHSAR